MAKYEVKRPHQGDQWYDVGDTRTAKPDDVKHLVRLGTLELVEGTDGDGDDDGPALTAIQRNLQSGEAMPIDQAVAEAVAAERVKFEDEKSSAIAQAIADAEMAARQHTDRLTQELAALKAENKAAAERQYVIGEQTSARVFKAFGIENLSDMQVVLDAVELALSAPPAAGEKSEAPDKNAIEPKTDNKSEPKTKDKAAS